MPMPSVAFWSLWEHVPVILKLLWKYSHVVGRPCWKETRQIQMINRQLSDFRSWKFEIFYKINSKKIAAHFIIAPQTGCWALDFSCHEHTMKPKKREFFVFRQCNPGTWKCTTAILRRQGCVQLEEQNPVFWCLCLLLFSIVCCAIPFPIALYEWYIVCWNQTFQPGW